jgi:thioredoxin reductase
MSKVVYRLIDPEQYAGQDVLVVGGGDSALEAAASVAECGGGVVLSYRGEAFARAKQANRERVSAAERDGKLKVMLSSNVQQILAEAVAIERQGRVFAVKNDAVIVSAGGVLPTDFLRRVGINVEAKFGTA